ncbi:hypothetical protein Taro_001864 [Colocasia esculenta]|uniref:Uncharacterized protein n=1 Tax=Colocasia esculenta TaxID=4460 RepID=A0A843TCF1_COLES|nr:hypothetical protein [Colocasia esculenta]
MLDYYGKVLEVRKQRPQDQRLPKTLAGSPARSANPSSSSGSGASYRKTRKALSPSSSVCFSVRGRRAGGACHRRQLALESGIESEDLEVPLSVHTPAEFWPKARLASISIDVDVVSASTLWTPTLSPASSDVDPNFSDLHALQSPKFRNKLPQPLGSCLQRSENLELHLAIYNDWEIAGASGKASPISL